MTGAAPPEEDHDAVVIGGGPSGATAAIALARQGRRVALVERAAFPRRKVCGEYLSATTLPVLDALGVGEAFRAAAGPEVRRVGLFAGTRVVLAPMPRSASGYGRALGRDVLDTLLLEAARREGVAVLQPARATRVEPAREGSDAAGHRVDVAMAGGARVLRAPVVVAAHGSWEPGPLPTQPARDHAPGDLFGFKAHLRGAALPADTMVLLAFPGGYGGLVMADGGRLSLSCCIRRDRLTGERRRAGGSAAEAVQRHLTRSMRGLADVLRDAAPEGPWLAAGPIRPGRRPGLAQGIFRVGNLAGESHPIIAEGIAMAIQSGWLLARELATCDLADPEALRRAGARYERAWRRQFDGRLRMAALYAGLFTRPGIAGPGAAITARLPVILSTGARLSGKTRPLRASARHPSA